METSTPLQISDIPPFIADMGDEIRNLEAKCNSAAGHADVRDGINKLSAMLAHAEQYLKHVPSTTQLGNQLSNAMQTGYIWLENARQKVG